MGTLCLLASGDVTGVVGLYGHVSHHPTRTLLRMRYIASLGNVAVTVEGH